MGLVLLGVVPSAGAATAAPVRDDFNGDGYQLLDININGYADLAAAAPGENGGGVAAYAKAGFGAELDQILREGV